MAVTQPYQFKLFISGMSVRSTRAVDNFKHICETYMKGCYELEIIDITQDKQKAIQYQIFALPTLLKVEPGPVRMILGDMSNKEKILKILDLA